MKLLKKFAGLGFASFLCCAAVTSTAVAGIVNINSADAETLAAQINGVGPRLAEAIVAHREEFGPYRSIEDLARVKGVGSKLVERNRELLKVKSATSEKASAGVKDASPVTEVDQERSDTDS